MTVRALGLVSLVLALGVGGYLFTRQAKQVGPTSELAQEAKTAASAASATSNLRGAVPELEAHHAETGSYAGAALPPTYGVVLVRADAAGYCLQAGSGATVQHLLGPSGSPLAGPC